MMKKQYQKAETTIIVLENADVITLSSQLIFDPSDEEEDEG